MKEFAKTDTEDIDSIMCDQFGKINGIPRPDRKATNIDLEMALRAYKADERQGWYVWKAPN